MYSQSSYTGSLGSYVYMESERAQLHAWSTDACTRENVKLCTYGFFERCALDSNEVCIRRRAKKCDYQHVTRVDCFIQRFLLAKLRICIGCYLRVQLAESFSFWEILEFVNQDLESFTVLFHLKVTKYIIGMKIPHLHVSITCKNSLRTYFQSGAIIRVRMLLFSPAKPRGGWREVEWNFRSRIWK